MENKMPGEALAQEGKILKKIARELAGLAEMGLGQLKLRYHELFGEEARSKNLPFLRKKLAFRIQECGEGGLSPHAQAIIEEIGPQDLPTAVSRKPKRATSAASNSGELAAARSRDPRLPAPGALLVREWEGLAHEVEVRPEGFAYRGRTYRSLSAIAKEITGTSWNGFTFFGLKAGTGHDQA